MECPRCGDALSESFYEGVEIHTCAECGGEFVAGEMLPRIIRTRKAAFSGESLREIEKRTPMFGVPAEEIVHDLRCPVCRRGMRPVNYGGDTAVIVDRCEQCDGVWLDHAELEKIHLILRTWSDEAPKKIAMISHRLEDARREAAEAVGGAYQASRFSFVNAVINRLLDAA